MQAERHRLTNAASWVLFLVGLGLAGLMSVVILNAERLWGMKQVVAAGPPFVLLLIYLVSMPLVFGALGLFKTTARRRAIAGAAMLVSNVAYMFMAAGDSFDWF